MAITCAPCSQHCSRRAPGLPFHHYGHFSATRTRINRIQFYHSRWCCDWHICSQARQDCCDAECSEQRRAAHTSQTRCQVSSSALMTHSAKKPYCTVTGADSWLPRIRYTLQHISQVGSPTTSFSIDHHRCRSFNRLVSTGVSENGQHARQEAEVESALVGVQQLVREQQENDVQPVHAPAAARAPVRTCLPSPASSGQEFI